MKTHSEFTQKRDFALLLIGPPLSGKTNVAMCFDSPYFLDCDMKLGNAVSRSKNKPFFYDTIDVDTETNASVPDEKRWERLTTLCKTNCLKPEVKTIVIDSLTKVSQYLIDHILATSGSKLSVGGVKVPEQQHWQPYKLLLTRFISALRGTGKLVIFVCHEIVDKDEITGQLVYRPLLSGQLRDSIGAYFTDVWRCETEQIGTTTRYYVRTTPTARMALGTSLNLPSTFNFTWEEFQKAVNNSQKPN